MVGVLLNAIDGGIAIVPLLWRAARVVEPNLSSHEHADG